MKKLLLLLQLLFLASVAFTQNKTVNGKVITEKGAPVSYASITVSGTNIATVCDRNGRFRITVRSYDVVLIVTAIGYTRETVTSLKADTITIVLKSEPASLQEVVVTAVGMGRVRHSIGYATNSLQGKASGLTVTNETIGFKTWKRSGIDENSVRLSVGDKDFIPLKSVQTAVQVDGFRARVLFDFFFYSDRKKRLRADFKLKLPAGASPFYFAFGGTTYLNNDMKEVRSPFVEYPSVMPLILNKDTIRHQRSNSWSTIREAIVAPKEKAAYAFNEVVRGDIDPALLEWGGADVFSCSVFPVEPDKLHHIVIGYDINLLEMGNDAVLNLALPYDKIEKKLDIDIAKTAGLQVALTPQLSTAISAAGRIKYHADHYTIKELSIAVHSEQTVFLQDREADKYFAVSYKPDIAPSETAALSPDAVFLLDVSLSSQPDKMNVWLKTMEGILTNNRKQIKRFAVLYFNVDAKWWEPAYMRNDAYNVDRFLNYAGRLTLVGATDLYHALKEAANPYWIRDTTIPKTLFLLSDGDASWGEDNLFQLSGLVNPKDKVYTYTTGFAETDTRVLDHLSRQTNGAVFSVLNEDEVNKASIAIQSLPWRIKTLSLDGATDLLVAGRPYNIFSGQKLIISGRGKISSQSNIVLTLEQKGITKTYNIPAKQIIASSLTTRVYGQTAVNQLEDFNFKTEEAAVKYATHFEVPGQTCSMVMLESKALYNRFGLDSMETARFVESTTVNSMIEKIIAEEKATQSLGSVKADMKAWLKKLDRDRVINFTADSLFTENYDRMPEAMFVANVPSPKMDLYTNEQWYAGTLSQLAQPNLDYDKVMRMVNNEKRLEGKGNAFKLISNFAEKNRGDLALLRDVAYTLNTWNLDGKAYELLKKIVLARPAEPATYTMIANSLLKMNKPDLAMIWYDLAFLTKWDNRFEGVNLVAAIQYARLLKDIKQGKYTVANKAFVQQRSIQLEDYLRDYKIDNTGADLMIVITWNTDNTDVDLHVREPSGEECFYSHPNTASGGYLSDDATEGFGPEMYILKNAPAGKYHLDIDYYSESNIRTSSQSKIMVDAYRNWGKPGEKHLRKVISLKSSEKKKRPGKAEEEEDDDKLLKDVLVIEF